MGKLEELAREIESIHDRKEELAPLAAHARDDSYPRANLLQELLDARLGFFGHKLATGYYDDNAANFEKHMQQAEADKQAAELVKDAVKEPADQPTPPAVDPVQAAPKGPEDLCEVCQMRLDSEYHRMQCEAGPHEVPPQPSVESNPNLEQPAEVPAEEVGKNEGTEDRPVTPPPADPSAPAPTVSDGNEAPVAEAAMSDEELMTDTPAPAQPSVEHNPNLEQPSADLTPDDAALLDTPSDGKTTTDSMQFAENPNENADQARSVESNPNLEAPVGGTESAPAGTPENADQDAPEENQPAATPNVDTRSVGERNPLLENPQPQEE